MIGVNRRRVMGGRPKDYLAFEALQNVTFTPPQDMEYSLDGFRFVPITAGSVSPTVSAGKKIYWRAILDGGTEGIGAFKSSGQFNVSGNLLSLCYGDSFEKESAMKGCIGRELFRGCRVLDASNLILPSMNLIPNCYKAMFFQSQLSIPPVLPATVLVEHCYESMFSSTYLSEAPLLPATELAESCYADMFRSCRFEKAPNLPAEVMYNRCYENMFWNCSRLTMPPALPATSLASYCYNSMFRNCTSLVTAPELPATTLVTYCYYHMFDGCASLNQIKALFLNNPTNSLTGSWLSGVSANGTFVKNSAATWDVTGVNGVPEGWTIEYADE